MTNLSALEAIPGLAKICRQLLDDYACGRCPQFKALATRLVEQGEQKGVFRLSLVGSPLVDDAVLFIFLSILAETFPTSDCESQMKVSSYRFIVCGASVIY